MGRLADRFGRGRVLLGGYALLLARLRAAAAAARRLAARSIAVARRCSARYYAATDGVLMALGSTVVPEEVRGSGLALLRTATSLARLVASIAFGALWTLWGIDVALAVLRRRARRRGGALAAVVLARAGRRSPPVAERGRRAAVFGAARRRSASPARSAAIVSAAAARARRRRPAASARAAAAAGRAERPPASSSSAGVDARRPASPSRRSRTRPARAAARRRCSCDRVYFAAGRGLCLARGERLRGGLPARASSGPTCKRAPASVDVDGIAEPRARVARRPLRRGHALRHRPLLRRRRPVLDRDDADRHAQRRARSPTSRSSPSPATARQITAVDVNFWGVTFARDSDRFYATLATGGKTYLIEGSVARAHGARCSTRTSSARRSRPTARASPTRSAPPRARGRGG